VSVTSCTWQATNKSLDDYDWGWGLGWVMLGCWEGLPANDDDDYEAVEEARMMQEAF